MITARAVHSSIANRQINPLSQLISEGVEIGDSILSELIGSTADKTATSISTPASTTAALLPSSSFISATASSRFSSSSVPTTSQTIRSTLAASSSTVQALTTFSTSTLQSSPVPAATTAARSIASHQSGGIPHSQKSLVIGFAVLIGILTLATIASGMWFWRWRLKKRRSLFTRVERADSNVDPAVHDGGLHATSDWPCNPPVPEPTLPALHSLTIRMDRYEPLGRVNSPVSASSRNPFLAPFEARLLESRPIWQQDSYTTQSSNDQRGSDADGTLASPMVLVEGPSNIPVEVEGDAGSLLERDSRYRSRAIWPSRTDSLKFDFGFDREFEDRHRTEPASFQVPRRPIGGRIIEQGYMSV